MSYTLGRIVEHDERSRGYALPESDLSKLKSKRWARHVPIFDQGAIGSCTGNSMLGALGTSTHFEALKTLGKSPEYSQATAIDIYSSATKIDGFKDEYPPVDRGSSGLAVSKIAKERGWIDSYLHAFTFNAVCTALQEGPAICGIPWYNSFMNPVKGECILKGERTKGVHAGHQILLDEIDVDNQRIWFTNSWGSLWGIGGRAYFSFDTLKELLGMQGDVTYFVPITEAGPTETTVWQNYKLFFKSLGEIIISLIGQLWKRK